MAVNATSSPPPIATFDQNDYIANLNTYSTEIKTRQRALCIFNAIGLLVVPVALVSVVIAQILNPIAIICGLIAVVVLGVICCQRLKHQVALRRAQRLFETYVDNFIAEDDYQQMGVKISILQKYPNIYRYLDLSNFEPGVSWVKTKKYCMKFFPELSEDIDRQFSAVTPYPRMISLQEVNQLCGEHQKRPVDPRELQEYLAEVKKDIVDFLEKARRPHRDKFTISDAEQLYNALRPRFVFESDFRFYNIINSEEAVGSYPSYQQVRQLSARIEAMPDQ